jgi:NAD(P)-dependent dehydrogenase (short-subunit alcohol dehydrogenase family)
MADRRLYTAKLDCSRVLIADGSSGLGLALAEAYVDHDATVVISSSLEAILTHLPSVKDRVSGHVFDSGSSQVEANIKELLEMVGTVGHIVFTAGNKPTVIPIEHLTLFKDFGPILFHYFCAGATGEASEKPFSIDLNRIEQTFRRSSTISSLGDRTAPGNGSWILQS